MVSCPVCTDSLDPISSSHSAIHVNQMISASEATSPIIPDASALPAELAAPIGQLPLRKEQQLRAEGVGTARQSWEHSCGSE